MIEISEEINQVLAIIKARFGLKTKSEAITWVVAEYGAEMLEPELKPEYVKKLRELEKNGKFLTFNSIEALRNSIGGGQGSFGSFSILPLSYS